MKTKYICSGICKGLGKKVYLEAKGDKLICPECKATYDRKLADNHYTEKPTKQPNTSNSQHNRFWKAIAIIVIILMLVGLGGLAYGYKEGYIQTKHYLNQTQTQTCPNCPACPACNSECNVKCAEIPECKTWTLNELEKYCYDNYNITDSS